MKVKIKRTHVNSVVPGYAKDGDAAMDLLLSLPEIRGCSLRTLDIATSDQLMVEFGQRIPVVAIGDAQLDAPFNAEKFREWLQNNAAC